MLEVSCHKRYVLRTTRPPRHSNYTFSNLKHINFIKTICFQFANATFVKPPQSFCNDTCCKKFYLFKCKQTVPVFQLYFFSIWKNSGCNKIYVFEIGKVIIGRPRASNCVFAWTAASRMLSKGFPFQITSCINRSSHASAATGSLHFHAEFG